MSDAVDTRTFPQFVPHTMVTFCEVFHCHKPAKWSIGRPDGPANIRMNVCEDCAKKIVELLPDELRYRPRLKIVKDTARAKLLAVDMDTGREAGEVSVSQELYDELFPPDAYSCTCPRCGKVFTGRTEAEAFFRRNGHMSRTKCGLSYTKDG